MDPPLPPSSTRTTLRTRTHTVATRSTDGYDVYTHACMHRANHQHPRTRPHARPWNRSRPTLARESRAEEARRGKQGEVPPAYIRGTLSRAADVAEDAAGVVCAARDPPPVHLPVLLRATLPAPTAFHLQQPPSALLQPSLTRCTSRPAPCGRPTCPRAFANHALLDLSLPLAIFRFSKGATWWCYMVDDEVEDSVVWTLDWGYWMTNYGLEVVFIDECFSIFRNSLDDALIEIS